MADTAQARREAQRMARAGRRTVAELEIERADSRASALSAETASLRAQAAHARATLQRHRVVAPFAGTISARHVDPGDWVSPGTIVLDLVADDRTEVLVRVEPDLLDDVGLGAEAEVRRGTRASTTTVVGVVGALDPATRTAQLRLASDESPRWLLPGAAVDVHFTFEHSGEGVIVPRDALVEGVAQTRVVKVVDGRAQPVVVEVLERGVHEARVRAEGLAAGDVVVTRGNERLRPDEPVRVVEP